MADRMSNEQAVLIGRAIKAGWPHQKFDDATVDVWAQGLRHVNPPLCYADCETAVYRLVSKASFSGPADIVAEVRRIRDDRLQDIDPSTVTPNVDPDDHRAWLAEVAAIRTAIADGRFDRTAYEASGRALSGVRAVKAIGDGRKPAELEGRVSLGAARLALVTRRVPAPLPCDYEPYREPAMPVREYSDTELAAQEARRAASLLALKAMEDQFGEDFAAIRSVLTEGRPGEITNDAAARVAQSRSGELQAMQVPADVQDVTETGEVAS